ncbi:unnamed protein product, partial [Discosporangium mesarthrocarpum]
VRAVHGLADGKLASSSQDATAKLWIPRSNEGNTSMYYEMGETLADHNHWVTALSSLPGGVLPECPQGGLVTGCLDKLVRIYDHQGKPQRVLKGHDGGVISFSWTTGGQWELGRYGQDLGSVCRDLHDHPVWA